MSMFLLALVLGATLAVILSGVWVAIALIDAVWHVDRGTRDDPAATPGPDARDTGRNVG